MTKTREWLKSIGLEVYSEHFAENAIDLEALFRLTEPDLRDLGVEPRDCRTMLRAIENTKGATRDGSQATRKTSWNDDAERRQLTVMICDMVGSSELSARLDPEDMVQVMSAFHNLIGTTFRSYQGVIARSMGDGVLAIFGYPRAHEDDAEQAVRAGLALIDAMPSLKTNVDVQVQVRVGVATGTVVVGDLLAGDGGGERTVIGDTPNLAARLQTSAEPGALFICEDTYRLTKGHFKFRDLGPMELKGWAKPKQVWQALEVSGEESRFEARQSSQLQPLVGREEEIELLTRRWRQATQGEGRVVVLAGEAGIGKSRIARALYEEIQGEPHITLRYYCSAHHGNSALFPIVRQLQRAAGFRRTDTVEEKLAKLKALLAQSTTNKEHVGLLANLLSLPCDEDCALPDAGSQKRKEQTLEALLAQLVGLASKRPVFMIFEDVHWIDPTSLELVSAIVERAPQLPLLVLATARPEFVPPWPGYAHTTAMTLTRLSRSVCTGLVERVARGKILPEEVVSEILDRTDGVPLFVEELTKTVLESELLDEQKGRYVLNGPLPSRAIPTTLHASLMARLDRLAPAREVAQIGAVIGREFSYELLCALAELSEQRLEQALAQLVDSELVFRRGEIPQAVYAFKHVLVHDVAYSSLLKSRRGHLHGVIARTLEHEFPDVARTQPETLGHHFTEAGVLDRASEYWLRAGKDAALRFANIEAIAHLQTGIEVLGRLPPSSERDRTELDLQFVLGPCLIATEGPASANAMATFVRARELCQSLGDPPEFLQVVFWLTTASVVRGELLKAQESIVDLLRLAETRGDRAVLLNAMRGHAMILLFLGHVVDAQSAVELAIQTFEQSDEPERLAARAAGQDAGVAGLSLSSWALWVLGYGDRGAEQIDAALQRAYEVQHPHSQAYAHYYASVLYAFRDETSLALEHAKKCRALSEEHGFQQWRGLADAVVGVCTAAQEESYNALDPVNDALEEYRSAGYQLGITALLVLWCPVLLGKEQPELALEVIDRGLLTTSRNNERLFEAELYRLKARALLAQGGFEKAGGKAQSLLQDSLATARKQQARSLELRAATDLAKIWMGDGQRAEALELLVPVYDWFTEGFDTLMLQNAKDVIDQLR